MTVVICEPQQRRRLPYAAVRKYILLLLLLLSTWKFSAYSVLAADGSLIGVSGCIRNNNNNNNNNIIIGTYENNNRTERKENRSPRKTRVRVLK